MIIDTTIRILIAAAALSLTVCGQAYALTVYDVIKLSSKDYSNQDIVSLIEVTDSTFSLQAKDIPRLMDLGVNETVIQAMLQAKHVAKQPDSSANPAQWQPNVPVNAGHKDSVNGDHFDATDKVAKPAGTPPVFIASNKVIARKGFYAEPFEEAAKHGHDHRVITLEGLRLFVLRDEGQYASIAARANAVVNRLEEAAAYGSGKFQLVHISGKDAVIFSGRHGTRSVVIVSVSADDAYTYQIRSGRQVTAELLAAYWSALLSDYWSVVIADEPPSKLLTLHDGETLQLLYDRWVASSASDDYSKLSITLLSLSNQQREHLLRLATWVPRDFNSGGLSIAEHP